MKITLFSMYIKHYVLNKSFVSPWRKKLKRSLRQHRLIDYRFSILLNYERICFFILHTAHCTLCQILQNSERIFLTGKKIMGMTSVRIFQLHLIFMSSQFSSLYTFYFLHGYVNSCIFSSVLFVICSLVVYVCISVGMYFFQLLVAGCIYFPFPILVLKFKAKS